MPESMTAHVLILEINSPFSPVVNLPNMYRDMRLEKGSLFLQDVQLTQLHRQ